MENLLGRLARKTCLGDLVGHNYPAYIYIYLYIYKYIYIYTYITTLRRLACKACLEVILGRLASIW